MSRTNASRIASSSVQRSGSGKSSPKLRSEYPCSSTSATILRCTSSSDGLLVREQPAAAPVRQGAVVEHVGRADPAALERLRVRVDPIGEHAVQPARELCLPPVHGRGPTVPARDEGLLRVPRLAAAAARAACRAGRARAVHALRARRASRARPRRRAQPRARRAAALGARRGRRREARRSSGRAATAAISRPFSARSAPRIAPTSSSRPSTRSASRSFSLRRAGRLRRAARVRGDRAARAARAASLRAHAASCTRMRSRAARRSSRTASARPSELRGWLARARRVACRSRSCRSASTPTRSGRRRAADARRRVGRARTRTATFRLLLEVARRAARDELPVVATRRQRARRSRDCPPNVSVEVDLPFERDARRLEGARVVALPVRENTYSGATTVLLQAMALEKPVVVSRTSAIATGYELVDGENCRLVEPGDASSFAKSLRDVLGDDVHARALGGERARTVERDAHVGSRTSTGSRRSRACCGG